MEARTGFIKTVKNEQDARTVEGMQKTPPTKVYGKNRVPGEVAGSADTALGKRGRRSGRADTAHSETIAQSHEASPAVGDLPVEHSAAVQNCAATPGRVVLNIPLLCGAMEVARTGTRCHQGMLPPSWEIGMPDAAALF